MKATTNRRHCVHHTHSQPNYQTEFVQLFRTRSGNQKSKPWISRLKIEEVFAFQNHIVLSCEDLDIRRLKFLRI
ncbi:hypothetical protein MRB53_029240 [Persea americana]|uniref:Uncharacterized protein n=1 Tax=Persea americana TaxID=3435 RepID=A0ACC2KHW2_PERAE|nr:hypothetical protein MRB53_029240 [Persea americana]